MIIRTDDGVVTPAMIRYARDYKGESKRMRTLKAAAMLAVGVMISLLAAQNSATADGSTPVVWGASVQANTGETLTAAKTRYETAVGRRLGATRDFLLWDSAFPTTYETGMKNAGTIVMLSVATKTKAGALISWAAIATAQPGDAVYTVMKSWADRIRDFAVPMYVTLQHEPEAANKANGTQAEYIAAWQSWVTLLRSEGATNVKNTWITTAFAYTVATTDRRYAPGWYPGDAYVDAIGVDAYNWFSCRLSTPNTPWHSLQQLIEPMRQFTLLHPAAEPWVTEFASVEDPANAARRPQWIADAQALFHAPDFAPFRGLLYYEQKRTCDWRVANNTSDSLAAMATMGADPYFAG